MSSQEYSPGDSPDFAKPEEYSGSRYEADNIHEALIDAKEQRKRADQDAKILANRIALLKAEEAKAWKKIEETKKRANEIMRTRQRNQEQALKRQEAQRAKDEEQKIRAYNNRLAKAQHAENKRTAANSRAQKLQSDVSNARRTKAEHQSILAEEKARQEAYNHQVKNRVRNQKREAEERRARMEAEKRMRARADMERRIDEEQRIRQEREDAVARMEQEELDLIARLQNTQSMQRSAYEDLESALAGGSPE